MEADAYCSSLGTEGRVWRLPTIDELYGLIDKSRDSIDPYIYREFECAIDVYWTDDAPVDGVARVVDFDAGGIMTAGGVTDFPLWTRCVADTQP